MKERRTFVVSDVHGAYKAFIQCLQRADFDYSNDELIFLGDAFDGWPDMALFLEELTKIENLVFVRGNHEEFVLDWVETAIISKDWLANNGQTTLACFPDGIPGKYLEMIRNSRLYYLSDNRLFVHASVIPGTSPEKTGKEVLLWDRSLFYNVFQGFEMQNNTRIFNFDQVFIGHTPLNKFGIFRPVNAAGVWLMDTGAGWTGCLSMMNIDSFEVFASDMVTSLYPGIRGRI